MGSMHLPWNRPDWRANALNGVLLGVLYWVPTASALAAGPTIGDLIAVCDRAFALGYRGLDAATCEWFAVPCACKPRDPGGPGLPWCVPDAEPVEMTVRKVVAALRLDLDPEASAEPAVRAVLARLYPCADKSKPVP